MASSRYSRNDHRPGYIEPDVTPKTESRPYVGLHRHDDCHECQRREQEAASKAVTEVLDRLERGVAHTRPWSKAVVLALIDAERIKP